MRWIVGLIQIFPSKNFVVPGRMVPPVTGMRTRRVPRRALNVQGAQLLTCIVAPQMTGKSVTDPARESRVC